MVCWCWCQRRKRMLVRQFVLHTQLTPLLTFAPWPNGCIDVWPVYNLFHFIHLTSVLSKFGYKIKKSHLRPSMRLDAPVWLNVKIAVCDAIWFFFDGYRRPRWRWAQQALPNFGTVSTNLHGVASQDTVNFCYLISDVKFSPKNFLVFHCYCVFISAYMCQEGAIPLQNRHKDIRVTGSKLSQRSDLSVA